MTAAPAGATVDARDRFGTTPLPVALFKVLVRDGEVVRVLVAADADPDSGISPRELAEIVANDDLTRSFE